MLGTYVLLLYYSIMCTGMCFGKRIRVQVQQCIPVYRVFCMPPKSSKVNGEYAVPVCTLLYILYYYRSSTYFVNLPQYEFHVHNKKLPKSVNSCTSIPYASYCVNTCQIVNVNCVNCLVHFLGYSHYDANTLVLATLFSAHFGKV